MAEAHKDDENVSPKDEEKKAVNDRKMKSARDKACIDIMSPYYIHAADHPGQNFVSEPLNDGNYGE